jgi:glycosyltransferase involved in cell wall biosynthesis
MNATTVSVIIPAYNRAFSLRRCIESVLNQTYQPFEIIIVDDGSTDDTCNLMESYLKNPQIKYIKYDTCKGAQAARNTGIKNSCGDYIAFLDSDDELLPTSLEVRFKAAQHNNFEPSLTYGDIIVEFNSNMEPFNFTRLQGYSYKYLLRELSLCPYSVIMVKRECFDVAGYPDRDFPSWQDDDLVLTIGKYFPVIHCGHPVAIIHSGDTQISKNNAILASGCKRMVNKYKGDIIKHHGRFRLYIWYLRLVRSYILAKRQGIRSTAGETRYILFLPYYFLLTAIGTLVTIILKPFFDHIYA